jgi:hypothetical protein
MQQQIARETKRDSSAMKSLSLLTMVFLPATAIAVSECTSSALIPVSTSPSRKLKKSFPDEKNPSSLYPLE